MNTTKNSARNSIISLLSKAICIFVLIVTYLICKLVHIDTGYIIGFVVCKLITTFITTIALYLFINRLEEFKKLQIRIKNLIFKRKLKCT